MSAWDNYYNTLAIKSMEPGVEPTVECRSCGEVVDEDTLVTCIACGRRGCRQCLAQVPETGDWYCRESEECKQFATSHLDGED